MSQKTVSWQKGALQLLKYEKIRFGLVGIVNTIVDFLILFTLARLLAVPTLLANIISTSTALGVSYMLNKKAVFRNTSPHNSRQLMYFVIGTLVGLWLLQSIVIAGVIYLLEHAVREMSLTIVLLIAKVCATIVALTWNYLWYSRVVFKNGSA